MTNPDQEVLLDEFLQTIEKRARSESTRLKRRSKGIVDIRVRVRPQKLVAFNVILSDKRDELDAIILEGDYPLKHEYGPIYSVEFEVPRGSARLEVHSMGKMVMLSSRGQGWFITAQIAKVPHVGKTTNNDATLHGTPAEGSS